MTKGKSKKRRASVVIGIAEGKDTTVVNEFKNKRVKVGSLIAKDGATQINIF